MIVALRGVVLAWLLLAAGPLPAANPEGVIAQLGDAAVTLLDVEAALLDKPEEERDSILADPRAIGNMLETLLLRRAVVADAPGLLDARQIEAARAAGREEALAKLAQMAMVDRAVDARAIEARAYELYEAMVEETPELWDLTVVTFPLDQGWREAKAEAERIAAAVAAGELDFDAWVASIDGDRPALNRFEEVRPNSLNPRVRSVVEPLEERAVAGPIVGPVGYQLVRLDDRIETEPSPFSASRDHWSAQAEKQLEAEMTTQVQASASRSELLDFAQAHDVGTVGVEAEFVRQAEEEALLRAYRDAFVAQETDGDVDQLAYEIYVTQRDRYRHPAKTDLALAHLPELPSPGSRQSIVDAVESKGIIALAEAIRATGLDVLRFVANQAVPLHALDGGFAQAVTQTAQAGESVGFAEFEGDIYAYAVANFQAAEPRSYEEVADEIRRKVRDDLSSRVWESHLGAYRNLELIADPDAVAALRSG